MPLEAPGEYCPGPSDESEQIHGAQGIRRTATRFADAADAIPPERGDAPLFENACLTTQEELQNDRRIP
jgi:hypothetical protein